MGREELPQRESAERLMMNMCVVAGDLHGDACDQLSSLVSAAIMLCGKSQYI
jgi:hypothetical protein